METKLKNHGAPWTDEANKQLLELFNDGSDPHHMSKEIGRTEGAIIGQLERLGKVVNLRGKVYKLKPWWDARKQPSEFPGVRQVKLHTDSVDTYLVSPFKYLQDGHVSAFIEDLENFRREGAQYTLEQWQESSLDLPGYARHSRHVPLLDLGIACNLGGWLAVSPSFKAGGGHVTNNGQPEINNVYGEYALSIWFGIPVEIAGSLIGTSYPGYYDKVDVSTLDKAIEALERMRATGNPGVNL